MRTPHHLLLSAISLISALASCGEPDCPSYLRGEGDDCIAPSKPDADTERELPQTMALDAGTERAPIAGAGGRAGRGGDGGGGAGGIGGSGAMGHDAGTAAGSGGDLDAGLPRNSAGSGGTSMMMLPNAGAPAPACGNGKREGSELCDGADCPTECKSDNMCIISRLEGSVKSCDAQCMMTEITDCKSGDGCCPMGCNHGIDTDCSPSCGDGVLTGQELCEPGSSKDPCPTAASCDDNDPCTSDKITGDPMQCSAKCTHTRITRAANGDMCCPQGANQTTDADCEPKCGNGVVESGEICDGDCPTSCQGSDSCATKTLVGSASQCNAECRETKVGTPKTYFQDCDGDGYPAQSTGMQACEPPTGGGCAWTDRAPTNTTIDCDDKNAARHPGADFGLPITRTGQQLPSVGDQAYDLDCDGVLTRGNAATLSTGLIKQGKLELVELCGATSSCSAGGPPCVMSFPVTGGAATCGEAYPTQTICGGAEINVYFLCR